MIWESCCWKKDLIKDAEILEKWARKKSSTRQYVLFEKKIFISAFVIRKLIESEKLCPNFPMWDLSIEKYPKKTQKKLDILNNHRIEEFYSLEKGLKENTTLKELSNLLIHSYIFCLIFTEEDYITGFFVTSDNEKEKYLYKIDLESFANILKWIGHSDIIKLHYERNSKKKSGFKSVREYAFDDCIPRKGLPKKKITLLSECLPKVDKQL